MAQEDGVRQDERGYAELLATLAASHPRLAKQLTVAERMRSERTALLAGGARFAGLEELLSRLDHIAAEWNQDPHLRKIAFLVDRATVDIETAVEAMLSGYVRVALDCMRDVMEIELHLLDFYVEPDHVEEWLGASAKVRRNKFSPYAVRKRLIACGIHRVASTEEIDRDYHGHSEALHVEPHPPSFAFQHKGHVATGHLRSIDVCLAEVFEHTRRLGNALLIVAHRMSPNSAASEASGGALPAFSLAHERTQAMVGALFRALERPTDELNTNDQVSS